MFGWGFDSDSALCELGRPDSRRWLGRALGFGQDPFWSCVGTDCGDVENNVRYSTVRVDIRHAIEMT